MSTASVLIGLGVAGHAAVLLDQLNTAAVNPFSSVSQIYGPAFPNFNVVVIDDFVLAGPTTVTQVEAGFKAQNAAAGFAAITAWDVNVYSSVAAASGSGTSLVGDVFHASIPTAQVIRSILGANDSRYTLATIPVSLPISAAGTYWIGVSPQLSFVTSGLVELVYTGSGDAVGINPGLSQGTGGQESLFANASLRLTGFAGVPEAQTYAAAFGVLAMAAGSYLRRSR